MDLTNRHAVEPETLCDVLVVGGGPAGSTIAALLSARGFRTAIVEKDIHPRFHIGESLLPFNLPLLRQLGVLDDVARIGMLKWGAEFVSPYDNKSVSYLFSKIRNRSFTYAYQVRRSQFDQILFENAKKSGAAAVEGCRIEHVELLSAGGARVSGHMANGAQRRWRTSFLVDASGRDTLLASKLRIKKRNPRHSTAALYGHFLGANRLPGDAAGNISIIWFAHGWFWFIPLLDGTTSVGAVCSPAYIKSRTTDLDSFFMATIALSSELSIRLKDARLTAAVTGTGNYSYLSGQMTGRSYIMIGDAFAFIDPIFSTGIYLAMTCAFNGADAVEVCLRDPGRASQAMKTFEVRVRRRLRVFSWYIYRATRPAMRNLFVSPSNRFGLEEALLSLLAGDVERRSLMPPRLMLFKLIYYLGCLKTPVTSFRAWTSHKRGIGQITEKMAQEAMGS